VGAVSGWRWWQGHLDAGRLEAGAKYMQMVHALERGERSQAMVLLGELEREHAGSPYTDQARLLAARLYVDSGELDKAAEPFERVRFESGSRREILLEFRLVKWHGTENLVSGANRLFREDAIAAFSER